MAAALKGHIEMVKVLIAVGADVNAKDDEGKTPLYWAETMDHKAIGQILKNAGTHNQTLANDR